MTPRKHGWNANLPTRWLTDATMIDLSGGAFATHARALMYGIEHENDGFIPTKVLRLLVPHDAQSSDVTAELVDAKLWRATGSGFQIVHWAETQTTRAQAERTRKQNRDRQREFQARRKAESESGVSNALVTQPAEMRPDQTSSDQVKPVSTSSSDELVTDWEVAAIPVESSFDPGYCSRHGGPWPCREQSPDCVLSST